MLKYRAIMNPSSSPCDYVSLRSVAVCNLSFVLHFVLFWNAATAMMCINLLCVASERALLPAVVCDTTSRVCYFSATNVYVHRYFYWQVSIKPCELVPVCCCPAQNKREFGKSIWRLQREGLIKCRAAILQPIIPLMATAAVCKYSSHQQSRCWRAPSRPAWGPVQTKATSGYSSQGCRQMETLASRQAPLYRTAMDKCGTLSHTVTHASLLHDSESLSESLFVLGFEDGAENQTLNYYLCRGGYVAVCPPALW